MDCKDCEYRPELCLAYGLNDPNCGHICLCCECQLITECPYLQEDDSNSDDLPF